MHVYLNAQDVIKINGVDMVIEVSTAIDARPLHPKVPAPGSDVGIDKPAAAPKKAAASTKKK